MAERSLFVPSALVHHQLTQHLDERGISWSQEPVGRWHKVTIRFDVDDERWAELEAWFRLRR
jgi:hypothetical protein